MKFLRNLNNKTRGGTKIEKWVLKAGVLSIVMVLAVVLTLVFKPQSASALTYGNYVYEVSNNEAIITGYTGRDLDISIPSSINGYRVTKIADNAFYKFVTLNSVVIPDSVTSIGAYSFYYCDSLTSIIIPNSVINIGEQAFYCCKSLESITIPNNVISMGKNAFGNCEKLVSAIISNSLTCISEELFSNCISLKSVTMPSNLTSISDSAFSNCTSLGSITIPNSVTHIGYQVFGGCISLESITIPNSVTEIGAGVFAGCEKLVSATISNSLTCISDDVFSYCKSLKSVTMPSNLAIIGGYAFSRCSSLESITIPNSVTNISVYAFDGCTSLKSITIPSNLTSIGAEAFNGCSSLTSVRFLGNAPTVGDEMNGYDLFGSCSNSLRVYYLYDKTGFTNPWCGFTTVAGYITPVNFTVSATSDSSINTSWSPVTEASGYELYRCTTSEGTYEKVIDTTDTSYTNTDLVTGTTYYYKVRSYKIVGTTTYYSDYSTIGSAKLIPAAPMNPKSVSSGYNSINTSWSAVAGATGYELYRCTTSEGTYEKIIDTIDTSYTNTGLVTGITYYYKVKAYKIFETTRVYSDYSTAVSEKPIPAAPTNLKSVSAGYNSINISWSVVAGASGYELFRATAGTAVSKIADVTALSYNNTGLATGTIYYYKLRAYKLVGTTRVYSDYSTVVNAKPILTAPASPKSVSSGYNSINISWSVVAGATGYELFRATAGVAVSKIADVTALSYNNTGLATGTTYYYKLRAYRIVGTTRVYSDYSTVVNAKPILTAPASPKSVSSGYNSINISWSAVAGATGYELFRATASTAVSKIADVTTLSYNNTGLVTGTIYYYKVRAYRIVGTTRVYSDYSTVVSAKPVPATPTNLKVVRASATSINTSWSAVSGATGYMVFRATSSTGTYSFVKDTTALNFINTGLNKGVTYYYKVVAYRTVGTTRVYSGFTSVIFI